MASAMAIHRGSFAKEAIGGIVEPPAHHEPPFGGEFTQS
jgi:hypothetical protein